MEQKCKKKLRFPLSWYREWSKSRIFCRKVHFLMHFFSPGIGNGAKIGVFEGTLARVRECTENFFFRAQTGVAFIFFV